MSELKLDTNELNELYLDLLNVSIAFSDAEQVSKSLCDAVGHDGLSARVGDFANAWDIRRAAIMKSIDTIWNAAKNIGTTFDSVESELDKVLRGGATATNEAG